MMNAMAAGPTSKRDAPNVGRQAVAIRTVRDDHITAGEAVTVGPTYNVDNFGEMGILTTRFDCQEEGHRWWVQSGR